ncbi:GAF domain-containing protein [Dactylosporangium sp. CA-052675]|uniref:GAF domain-containing protein n=1 Tax=Dactylosporangium sp. CA-052675 TaxID=3239927 RepID=UPI003D8E531A
MTEDLSDLERLRAITRYDLDDPQLRRALGVITAETSQRLPGSLTAVNILLDRAVLTMALHGAEHSMTAAVGGAPAEWSFCSRVVAEGRAQVIDDVALDTGGDVDGRPLAAAGIHSYAGVPLATGDGHTIGTHCALHPLRGHYDEGTIAVLEAAAERIRHELDHALVGG